MANAHSIRKKREQARLRAAHFRARKRGENVPLQKNGVAKGYKQTPEHIEKRKRVGAQHHAWEGDAVSTQGGRSRANRRYPEGKPCDLCSQPSLDRHHKDGNTANNEPENVQFLCRRCHMKEDGRLAEFTATSTMHQKLATKAAAAKHVDTDVRSGDPCPTCGGRLSRVCSRPRNGYRMVYIGCRKSRRGCGHNAGSFREPME